MQDIIDTKPFADAGWMIQDRDLEVISQHETNARYKNDIV